MKNIHRIPFEEFEQTMFNMRTFQVVHNELRKDFKQIFELAKSKVDEADVIKPLIRSCFKELFSLIEADIYLLNQFNPYPNYNDKEDFSKKYKETFKHHSKTFNKVEINLNFNSVNFELLLKQKIKRDNVTHPKGKQSIEVTANNLEEIHTLYEKYTTFISTLMTDIGISIKPPLSNK